MVWVAFPFAVRKHPTKANCGTAGFLGSRRLRLLVISHLQAGHTER